MAKVIERELKALTEAFTASGKKLYDNDGNHVGTSFSLDSQEHRTAMQTARLKVSLERDKISEQNADEIKKVDAKIDALRAEIDGMKNRAKKIRNFNEKANDARDTAWKKIAKELNIKQYMTSNGGLSTAKTKARADGKAEWMRICDVYNRQFVPQINAAIQKIQHKYILTAGDKAFTNLYNGKNQEHTRLCETRKNLTGYYV